MRQLLPIHTTVCKGLMRELVGYLNWVKAIWTYQYLWITSTTENHARCQEWVWPPWCSLQSGTGIMKVGTGILAFLPHRCTSGLIGYPCQLWVKLAIQVNLLNWWRANKASCARTWHLAEEGWHQYHLFPTTQRQREEDNVSAYIPATVEKCLRDFCIALRRGLCMFYSPLESLS